ncbi:MAG: phosphotransferase [Candidatus Bipolaricaulota bacterium]
MKPYDKLTQRGRILRLRQAVRKALEAYGLEDASLRFNHDTGNASFRAAVPERLRHGRQGDVFVDGEYILRLNQPGYQSTALIASELMWLEALRSEADLPVPEPVRALDGNLVLEIEVPGSSGTRQCSLLRWVRGRMQEAGIGTPHLRATGHVMARMHVQASGWTPPSEFTRWRYDWEGLFGDANPTGVRAAVAHQHITPQVRPAYDAAVDRLRDVMAELGTGRSAFGLVHADIAFGDNILFWRGEARPIDFGDCAFAHWMYDIGVALSHVRQRSDWPALRQAFIEGYQEVRDLPSDQAKHLDLFIAAWHAYEILWAAAMVERYPQNREGNIAWMTEAGRNLRNALDRR